MDFSYTETQTMLRDTLARYLSDRYDHETRMKVSRSDAGWSAATWKAFAEELGILGAPFSEEQGGLGGGALENMIVMEELGSRLVVEPSLSPRLVATSGATPACCPCRTVRCSANCPWAVQLARRAATAAADAARRRRRRTDRTG